MKSIINFFKIITGIIMVFCGCYLFTEIVDKIKNGDDGDDDRCDEPKFINKVKSAAKVQIDRIK